MTSLTSCPAPFLAESAYPATGGYIPGRSCSSISGTNTSCCLPCPATDYVYSSSFNHNLSIAYWFNIPSLVLEAVLLFTFFLLRTTQGFTHLSINLVLAMIMLQLAFVIPLGTKPEQCHDGITPKGMRDSMSCAWTGALLVAGAMAVGVWIMLRSIWIHLRICWDVKFDNKRWGFWAAQVLGWGIPAVFLITELVITGVSYRIGPACVPNQHKAFVTWFGWLIAFGGIGALVQFCTTGFCLGVYLKEVVRPTKWEEGEESYFEEADQDQKKLAWGRVRKILKTQWRSMVLCTVLVICLIFYGVVFVQQTSSAFGDLSAAQTKQVQAWAICLVLNKGDKKNCGPAAKALGLSEGSIVATYYMASFVGIFAFALMFRTSMVTGWWFFLQHPQRAMRNPSIGDEDFIILNNVTPKRKSFGRPLESEKAVEDIPRVPTIGEMDFSPYNNPSHPYDAGILPEPKDSRQSSINQTTPPITRRPSYVPRSDSTTLGPIPEAGDVSRRHENPSVDMFNEDPYDVPKRTRGVRRRGDDEDDIV